MKNPFESRDARLYAFMTVSAVVVFMLGFCASVIPLIIWGIITVVVAWKI